MIPKAHGMDGARRLVQELAPAHDATELALSELARARVAAMEPSGKRPTSLALVWTRMAQLDVRAAHVSPVVRDAWEASHRALDHLSMAERLLADVDSVIVGAELSKRQLAAIGRVEQHLRAVSTRRRDEFGTVNFEDGWLSQAARAAIEPGYARDPRPVVYDPVWGGIRGADEVPTTPDARRLEAWNEQTMDHARAAAAGERESLKDGMDMVMLGKPVDLWLKELVDYPIPVEIARGKGRTLVSPLYKAELRIDKPVLADDYDHADQLALELARKTGVPHGVIAGSITKVAVSPLRVDRPWQRVVRGSEEDREKTLAGAQKALASHERVVWVDNLLSRVATPDGRLHQTTPGRDQRGGFNPRWPSPKSTLVEGSPT